MTEPVEFPGQSRQDPGPGPRSAADFVVPSSPAKAAVTDSSLPSPGQIEPLSSAIREPESTTVNQPEVRWREIFCVLSIVILADISIFRATGYAGAALFLMITPGLLLLGSPTPSLSVLLGVVSGLIGMASIRLIWQGSIGVAFAGFLLLIAFAMTIVRQTPYVLEVLAFTVSAMYQGIASVEVYGRWIRQQFRNYPQLFSLLWILPLGAVLVFSGIFVAANPDLAKVVQEALSEITQHVSRWLEAFSPSPMEVAFWIWIAWNAIGLLRPGIRHFASTAVDPAKSLSGQNSAAKKLDEHTAFAPIRNTLIAVSVLFAVYLVFEFRTLWFRKFPQGFHYSGYAHEGAAWLTVALALATAILSLIFRGRLLADPRLRQLRFWAWIWSVENFVLALAVYNRLWIYIGFNGMTRMRTVALLGITSVLVGFLLVVWKIVHNRGFLWLIRRHLLTVTLAGFVYLILPVDWLVYRYNVRRVLAGDPAPVVQITEHEVSPEGILTLPPLLESDDPIIREGIQSYLIEKALVNSKNPNQRPGWTSYQMVHFFLDQKLEPYSSAPDDYESRMSRSVAWQRLKGYAYQWY